MNLVMTAPLYDNKGTVKYFLGAQVDISGLVEEGRGLDSFERYLGENKRNRDSIQSFMNQRHTKALGELGQLLSAEESSVLEYVGEGSINDSDYGGSKNMRRLRGRRDPNLRLPRRVLGNEDDEEQEKDKNAWAFNSLGPSGKLPGVYQNVCLAPHTTVDLLTFQVSPPAPSSVSPHYLRVLGPSYSRPSPITFSLPHWRT